MKINIRNTNQSSAAIVGHQSRYAWLMMIAITLITFLPVNIAWAHGERMHSPASRMRSIQWYDVTWQGAGDIKVGDIVTIEGKIYLPSEEYWPSNMKRPDVGYLQTSGPAAVFVKLEGYISDKPIVQSGGLSLGNTYTFKVVMQARVPGKWHIHPTIQVTGSGPLVGPGEWTNVTGNMADLKISGVAGRDKDVTIDNLATYNLGAVFGWHTLWFVMGIIWVLWWIRRPTLLPRYRAVQERVDKHLLITASDKKFGVLMLVVTAVLVIGGAVNANATYDTVLPLQTGTVPLDPLAAQNSPLLVKGIKTTYNVPKRAMTIEASVVNNGDKPVKVGEFATAGIRFVVKPATLGGKATRVLEESIKGYPAEYIRDVLTVKGGTNVILPGESRTITLVAADAVWEIQSLSELVKSPVRRVGGIIFFFDEDGNRYTHYVDASTDIAYK